MTELYTLQRYLQYDTLAAKNLTHFDSWASIFGETQTSIELAPEGTGYRARTRFAKFHNLPEVVYCDGSLKELTNNQYAAAPSVAIRKRLQAANRRKKGGDNSDPVPHGARGTLWTTVHGGVAETATNQIAVVTAGGRKPPNPVVHGPQGMGPTI
jgi:hypothetical protein